MKIRVTHEVSDHQRLALGVALNGEFKMVNRETAEAWLIDTIQVELAEFDDVFDEMKAKVIEKLNLS